MIHVATPIKSSIQLLLVFSGLFFSFSVFAGDKLLIWSSQEGIERLARAEAKVDFFPLANHFESQNNKIYCGVASSAIVLNALRVRNDKTAKFLPPADSVLSKEDREYISALHSPFFDRYTQDNIFTEQAKSKLEILGKPIDKKRDFGLQLAQLQELLESHQLKVQKRVVTDKSDIEAIRAEFVQNLNSKDDYILVNYLRKTLNQKGGGHISPLGAYDKQSDSVLVMDVNSNKVDWVWVPLSLLIASMNTFDTVENRGYLLISEKQ